MIKTDFYFAGALCQSLELSGERLRVPVAPAGRTGPLQIRFSLPILDMQMYWTPECRVPISRLLWQIELNAAAQRYFPYLAFSTVAGMNRGSISISNFIDDCRLIARMNQETCNYDITITTVLQKETEDFYLYLDFRGDISWLDVLREYLQEQKLDVGDYPDGAWAPVFCTWYAVHAAVTQEWAEKTAAEAARLGFGTFIVDDGWCFDAMKRVSPETITTWYENIGDWEVSKKNFLIWRGMLLGCRRWDCSICYGWHRIWSAIRVGCIRRFVRNSGRNISRVITCSMSRALNPAGSCRKKLWDCWTVMVWTV